MVSYQIGNWTNGTLKTLKFIKDKNNEGNRPTTKDFPNGTYVNWAYVLKKAGYLNNGEGFGLTDKGKHLLNDLESNPPKERRGSRRKKLKNIESSKIQGSSYRIIIQGKDLTFENIVTLDKAKEVINLLLKK